VRGEGRVGAEIEEEVEVAQERAEVVAVGAREASVRATSACFDEDDEFGK